MRTYIFILMFALFFSSSYFAQQSGNKNTIGVELSALSNGPGLGIRGWQGSIGYAASAGIDWGFTDVNASARLMYALTQTQNRFFVLGRIGYYEISDEQSYFGMSASYKGSLLGVGVGIGYEWYITSSTAISVDGGYNFIGSLDYDMVFKTNFGTTKQSYKFKMPFWVGGSYTIYF